MSNTTHYIRGKVHWCKILGDPVPNYTKDGHEWTLDLTPDDDGLKLLKKLKLGDRIKNKDDERGDFIQFRQKATRQNGDPNRPITVVGPDNKPWDQTNKIGNGSIIDLKFNVRDYGVGKKDGVYPQAVRVLEHVEYQAQEFAPLSKEDTFYKDFGLEEQEQYEDGLNDPPFDQDDDEVA